MAHTCGVCGLPGAQTDLGSRVFPKHAGQGCLQFSVVLDILTIIASCPFSGSKPQTLRLSFKAQS